MSNVKMPEPVAVVVNDCAIFWAGSGPIAPLCKRTGAKVGSQLITTEQAEAYARERVNEAVDAIRQSLIKMERHSFITGQSGGVRKIRDPTGAWIEFSEVHTLLDPVKVDAAIDAAMKGES